MKYSGCAARTRRCPVIRHHAGISSTAPGSRATRWKIRPGAIARIRMRNCTISSPQPMSPASQYGALSSDPSMSFVTYPWFRHDTNGDEVRQHQLAQPIARKSRATGAIVREFPLTRKEECGPGLFEPSHARSVPSFKRFCGSQVQIPPGAPRSDAGFAHIRHLSRAV